VTVYEKTQANSPGKIWRKRGKVTPQFFFSIFDDPLMHFIHPKVQKYIQKCLKIAPNVIKIKIPLFKLQKYIKITFFPSFPRPTFQNVITHKIFEIL
jgi:hypothetical protein